MEQFGRWPEDIIYFTRPTVLCAVPTSSSVQPGASFDRRWSALAKPYKFQNITKAA